MVLSTLKKKHVHFPLSFQRAVNALGAGNKNTKYINGGKNKKDLKKQENENRRHEK